MISTVLLAEDMGLEPKKSLVCPYSLLSPLGIDSLELQGFEAVNLAITESQQM